MICDDDDGPFERDAAAEGDVAGDGQVVQLQDVRNRSKTLQKVSDLKNSFKLEKYFGLIETFFLELQLIRCKILLMFNKQTCQ